VSSLGYFVSVSDERAGNGNFQLRIYKEEMRNLSVTTPT
jgi:hypothetical protein